MKRLPFYSGKNVCREATEDSGRHSGYGRHTHTYIYTRLLSKWKQACCSNRSNLSPSAGAQRRDITNCGHTAHTQAYWCIYMQKTPTYPQSHPHLHKLTVYFLSHCHKPKKEKRKKKHLEPIRNSSNPINTQDPFSSLG